MHKLPALLTGCTLLFTVASASAQVSVAPTVTSPGVGYLYSYDVTNIGTTPIFGFDITVDSSPLTITSPLGWDASTYGLGTDTVIQWTDTDPNLDILPSLTLTGFSITSNGAPGSVDFTAADEDFNVFTGQTTGPVTVAAVPEGSSAIVMLFAGAITGVTLLICRRRKWSR